MARPGSQGCSVEARMEAGKTAARSGRMGDVEFAETSRLLATRDEQDAALDNQLSKEYISYNSIHPSTPSPWLHDISEHEPSLPEYHAVVHVPQNGGWWGRVAAYVGPGAMVAVGYMDPGNWSTDIAGGSSFGYDLLWVILLSSVTGMFLQYLSLKIGIATQRDLAQVCRDAYPQPVVTALWVVMEIAICATDVAEVLGAAIALKLLFNLPLFWGVLLTAFDVLVVLFLNTQHHAFRLMEALVVVLILVILVCFALQLVASSPDLGEMVQGMVPSLSVLRDQPRLFVAVGILGATVMPHNLFLHSSLVLTRDTARDRASVREAVRLSTLDSNVSLCVAFAVNAAIYVVSAATFHHHNHPEVSTLQEAYHLLDPLLHSHWASVLFAVALLASGQNSTLTGTLTGQIVMEGFMTWKLSPGMRRMVTRGLAILPALLAVGLCGDDCANDLLLLSQVVLSFALPFALAPLLHVSMLRVYMGDLVNSLWTSVAAAAVIVGVVALNVLLICLSSE